MACTQPMEVVQGLDRKPTSLDTEDQLDLHNSTYASETDVVPLTPPMSGKSSAGSAGLTTTPSSQEGERPCVRISSGTSIGSNEQSDDDCSDCKQQAAPQVANIAPDDLPSKGSAAHALGQCIRCCFFFKGRCRNGLSCQFCHFPHEKRSRGRGCRGHGTMKRAVIAAASTAAAELQTLSEDRGGEGAGGTVGQPAVRLPPGLEGVPPPRSVDDGRAFGIRVQGARALLATPPGASQISVKGTKRDASRQAETATSGSVADGPAIAPMIPRAAVGGAAALFSTPAVPNQPAWKAPPVLSTQAPVLQHDAQMPQPWLGCASTKQMQVPGGGQEPLGQPFRTQPVEPQTQPHQPCALPPPIGRSKGPEDPSAQMNPIFGTTPFKGAAELPRLLGVAGRMCSPTDTMKKLHAGQISTVPEAKVSQRQAVAWSQARAGNISLAQKQDEAVKTKPTSDKPSEPMPVKISLAEIDTVSGALPLDPSVPVKKRVPHWGA